VRNLRSQPVEAPPHAIGAENMTLRRSSYTKFAFSGLSLVATLAATQAAAQLATSPDAVQASRPSAQDGATEVPPVTVTAPTSTSAQPARRRVEQSEPATAPRAAEQTSAPRAVNKTRPPSSGGPAVIPAESTTVTTAPVTTTVSPTGIAQPVANAGGSVSVINSDEIDARQARNAPELLSSIPGLQVVQTGGPGGTTSIFIRGTNSNHTKVLIDGIDVSSPVDANRAFDFGLLTTFDIGRVEVLRGPQSGLYGADALGGVIVVYTREATRPVEVEAVIEGGSFGTLNEAVGARGRVGGFSYSFNASHSAVDGVTSTPRRILPADGTVPVLDNKYENWTFATKVGLEVSPNVAFNVAARYVDTEYRFQADSFPPPLLAFRTDSSLSTTRSDQLYTRAETIVTLLDGRIKTIAGVNYTGVDSETVNAIGDVSGAGFGSRVKGDIRTIIEVMPQLTVTTGADWQNERLTQPTVGTSPGFGVEEANSGAYIQAQFEPVRNMFLVGNYRYDDNESFGEATTWRIAPTAVIEATGTTFRAAFGTAFKAPSLSQRFQDFPAFFFFGNRDLRPEESRGMDIGFEQALFQGRARTGLTYFRNTITDLIQIKSDFSSVENIAEAQTSGIEVFASTDLSDTLRLRGDYTYTEATNVATGRDLIRRPRHKASLAVGWQALPPLLVTTSLLYVGEQFDGDRADFDFNNRPVRQPDYVTVNIAADYKVNDHVSLIGRVDNLLDKEYEDPNGFQRPGIGAYAGVRLRN